MTAYSRDDVTPEHILELYAEGLTTYAIAGRLRTRSETVTRRLRGVIDASARSRLSWQTRRRNLDARFWERADQSAGSEGCWLWTGSRQTPSVYGGGYGYFSRHGRIVYAHRRALELALGRALGSNEEAIHSCDNPPCINPSHLRAGTHRENMQDMVRKGRTGKPGSRINAPG